MVTLKPQTVMGRKAILGPVGIESTSVPFLPSPYRVAQSLSSGLDAIACEQCRVSHDGSCASPFTGSSRRKHKAHPWSGIGQTSCVSQIRYRIQIKSRTRGDAMSDSALARRPLVEDF